MGEDITYDKSDGFVYDNGVNQAEWLANHVTGSACYGHTNLVPEFCKAYIEQTRREILAAHAAKGSTVIADWLPGSQGYSMLVTKAAAARDQILAERIFFVWFQGESDALEGNKKHTIRRQSLICVKR